MKFDQLCTVISLLYCTGMNESSFYLLLVSHLVSECYVQRNNVLCRLKVITGRWGNTTLKLLIFHHI